MLVINFSLKACQVRLATILTVKKTFTNNQNYFYSLQNINPKKGSFNSRVVKNNGIKSSSEHKQILTTWSCVCGTMPVYNCDKRRLNGRRTFTRLHQVLQNKSLGGKLIQSTPSYIQPYLQLTRIDKPTGTFLLLWPCLWSVCLAAEAGNWPSLSTMTIFTLGAFLMRGAGCTINDMWDKSIDAKVQRTKDRPLASGKLDFTDALAFLALQLSCATFVLMQLDWTSILLGFSSMGLVVSYPLAKRFTNWPQLVLGLTFNWGALMGWSAAHGPSDWFHILPLYAAAVSWTLVYDTIYAHQDKKDDVKMGIKSTALLFGDSTTKWLGLFSCSMLGNLLLTGLLNHQTWPFYASTALVGLHLAMQIITLDINNNENCAKRFQSNALLGLILFGGIIAGNLLKEESKIQNVERTE